MSQKTGGRKKTASSLAEEILPKFAVIIPNSEGFAKLVSIATEVARLVKKRKAELITEVTDAGIMNTFQARQQSPATLQNILDVKQGKKQPAILQMLNATSVELGDRKPVLQDRLEVLRIRVRDETFRTLERLELRELRRLLKVHNVDITTSRQEKIFKKDCLNLLKPQIDKHFQILVDQQKICQETDRANAMELMHKTFVNMDEGQKPETKESKKGEWVQSFKRWRSITSDATAPPCKGRSTQHRRPVLQAHTAGGSPNLRPRAGPSVWCGCTNVSKRTSL